MIHVNKLSQNKQSTTWPLSPPPPVQDCSNRYTRWSRGPHIHTGQYRSSISAVPGGSSTGRSGSSTARSPSTSRHGHKCRPCRGNSRTDNETRCSRRANAERQVSWLVSSGERRFTRCHLLVIVLCAAQTRHRNG